jgi:GWxTD domain-containing protein
LSVTVPSNIKNNNLIFVSIMNRTSFLYLVLLLAISLAACKSEQGVLSGEVRKKAAKDNAARTNAISYTNDLGMFLNAGLSNKGTEYEISMELESERLYNAMRPVGISVSYEIKESYDNNAAVLQSGTAQLAPADWTKTANTFYASFRVPRVSPSGAVLWLRLNDEETGKSITKDIAVNQGQNALPFVLMRYDGQVGYKDVFNHYVTEADSLRFLGEAGLKLYVYRIRHNFMQALPPMQTNVLPTSAELRVDSLFEIGIGQTFQLKTRGLYFVQTDTTGNVGLGFHVMERGYPKYKNVENLVEALIYISSPEELESIYRAENKREAFENYWLKLGGTPERARQLIRLYYQRIEHVNRAFTHYKEGWKTDMGMIYTAFGEPSQVLRKAGQQQWIYNMGRGNEIRFTFIMKPNQFTGSHYELVRLPRYRDVWYPTIEKWRLGLVAN